MFTQTKSFELRLLEDLIKTGNFVNLIALENTTNAVAKYENGIEQSMVYAIEHETGQFDILKNDVIQPLLILLEEYRTEYGNALKPRRLANHRINICILESRSTDEERELFKQLVIK